jgi:hypothetical protein
MLIHLDLRVCVTIVSFSIQINGSATAFFRLGKGLRQGSPLSSFLFLIVAERLSRALTEAKRTGAFKGIMIGTNMFVPFVIR